MPPLLCACQKENVDQKVYVGRIKYCQLTYEEMYVVASLWPSTLCVKMNSRVCTVLLHLQKEPLSGWANGCVPAIEVLRLLPPSQLTYDAIHPSKSETNQELLSVLLSLAGISGSASIPKGQDFSPPVVTADVGPYSGPHWASLCR